MRVSDYPDREFAILSRNGPAHIIHRRFFSAPERARMVCGKAGGVEGEVRLDHRVCGNCVRGLATETFVGGELR